MLKNRIDLCTHAQILKDSDLSNLSEQEVNLHLESLQDFSDAFPVDIKAKLAARFCTAELEALSKLADPQAEKSKVDAFVDAACLFCSDIGMGAWTGEEDGRSIFVPKSPRFAALIADLKAQDGSMDLDWAQREEDEDKSDKKDKAPAGNWEAGRLQLCR